jgi:hypothetical protein
VAFPPATRRAGAAGAPAALLVTALVVLAVTACTAAPFTSEAPDDGSQRTRLFGFADRRITESSGLAVSALHDGVVYTHNDSGGGPVLYAIGPDGRTRAALTLRGAKARDWEALAPGGDGVLWVGDIGDNGNGWWQEIRVYRVREPRTLRDADVEWTRYRLRYEDGGRDAEALLADPRTGRLYVVSKQESGAGIYAAPAELRRNGENVLRRVADAPSEVTDGAFLPDGERVVLRGYFSATVYDRRWRELGTLPVPIQPQGESLAAARDGRAVLVGSEGAGADVWQLPLAQATRGGPAPAADAMPAGTPAGTRGHTVAVLGVLAVVLAVTLVLPLLKRKR